MSILPSELASSDPWTCQVVPVGSDASGDVAHTQQRPKNVAVLGSTGSIGRSAVEVIAASPQELRAVALCARRSVELLQQQVQQLRPRWVIVTEEDAGSLYDRESLPPGAELLVGADAVAQVVSDPTVDVVLSGVVGSAGFDGTWAALEAGKTVALANKESLVVGGALMMEQARRHGAQLLPVDSEHNAVFQALQAGRREELRRVILTASGGPFRDWSVEQLENVTVEAALAHPTWAMGPKISVDSATLMNKALEIIEARWLFDLDVDQITVTIHPQSIVHSMVEFVDGSVIAQLSPPDMKLPIQHALLWPRRCAGPTAKFDWSRGLHFDFQAPDLNRFQALKLGFEVARAGGTSGVVLNAANETAVAAFLDGKLPFHQIVPTCREMLERHEFEARPTIRRLNELDAWTRQEVTRRVRTR